MEPGEGANHPFAVVQLPVKRCAPLFAIDRFPAFGKPPAKVLIAAVVDEFEKLAVADWRFVDGEVLEEHLVRRLLVGKGEWGFIFIETNPDQAPSDVGHAFNLRR